MPDTSFTAYRQFLEGQRDAITRAVAEDVVAQIDLYRSLLANTVTQTTENALRAVFDALARADARPLLEWIEQRLLVRIDQGLTLPEALRLPAILRRHLIDSSLHAIAGQVAGAAEGMRFVNTICDKAVEFMGQLYSRRLEEARDTIIQAQELALRELSTPLLNVSDHVVVMPLVGAIDSRRAQQVIATLLEGITAYSADIAILDITGVPVVDTQVADALLRAAQAVRLLGAQVVLTGIRPEVAQTLVGLGADLSEIVSRSTLQSGIAYAIGRSAAHRAKRPLSG